MKLTQLAGEKMSHHVGVVGTTKNIYSTQSCTVLLQNADFFLTNEMRCRLRPAESSLARQKTMLTSYDFTHETSVDCYDLLTPSVCHFTQQKQQSGSVKREDTLMCTLISDNYKEGGEITDLIAAELNKSVNFSNLSV